MSAAIQGVKTLVGRPDDVAADGFADATWPRKGLETESPLITEKEGRVLLSEWPVKPEARFPDAILLQPGLVDRLREYVLRFVAVPRDAPAAPAPPLRDQNDCMERRR